MRCLGRLGCLVLVVALAFGGWWTRERWLPVRLLPSTQSSATSPAWEPLSNAGAARTRTALAKLSQPTGQVYQTLSGGDVASFVVDELAKHLPPSTDSIQATIVGDLMSMRAIVRPAEFGASRALGPLAGVLGDRERIQLGGTFHVIKPGLAEFVIQDVKVGGIGIPRGMIPRLVGQFDTGRRPAGVAGDALPLSIPRYIGDIRIANGKITLYRNVE
jgi:hypothetical protein